MSADRIAAAYKTAQRREEAEKRATSGSACSIPGCGDRASHVVEFHDTSPAPVCTDHRGDIAASRHTRTDIKRIVKLKVSKKASGVLNTQKLTGMRGEQDRRERQEAQEKVLTAAASDGPEAAGAQNIMAAAEVGDHMGENPTRHLCETCNGQAEHIIHRNPGNPRIDTMTPVCKSCKSDVMKKAASRGTTDEFIVHNLYTGKGNGPRRLREDIGRMYDAHIERVNTSLGTTDVDTGAGATSQRTMLAHTIDLMRSGEPPLSAEKAYLDQSGTSYKSDVFDDPRAKFIMEDAAKDVTKNKGDYVVHPRSPINPGTGPGYVGVTGKKKTDEDDDSSAAPAVLVPNPNASSSETAMGAGQSGVVMEGMSQERPTSTQRSFEWQQPPAGPHAHGEPYFVPNNAAVSTHTRVDEGGNNRVDNLRQRMLDFRQVGLAADMSTPLHVGEGEHAKAHFWGTCPDCSRYRPGIPTLETGKALNDVPNSPLNIGSDVTVSRSREIHPNFWRQGNVLGTKAYNDRTKERRWEKVPPAITPEGESIKSQAISLIGKHVAENQEAQLMEHLKDISADTLMDTETPFYKNVDAPARAISPYWRGVQEKTDSNKMLPAGPTTLDRYDRDEDSSEATRRPLCDTCGTRPSAHKVTISGEDFNSCSSCTRTTRSRVARGVAPEVEDIRGWKDASKPAVPKPTFRAPSEDVIAIRRELRNDAFKTDM
jgi:hypothetical protein